MVFRDHMHARSHFFFGDVIAGKIDLSDIGQIAQLYWAEIPSHFEHTYIDAYAIMPNHVLYMALLS
nr:hypothetical protein [Fischerella sp. PCC 9605]